MTLTGGENSFLLFFLRKTSGDRGHIRVRAPGLGLVIRSSAKSRVSQGRSYFESHLHGHLLLSLFIAGCRLPESEPTLRPLLFSALLW